MSTIDDGIIKYDRGQFIRSSALNLDEYESLEKWRKILYNINLIGEYLPEKIGFGNLSQKMDYKAYCQSNCCQFVITATQTGHLKELNGLSYTRVLDYNLEKQKIKVMGPKEASSEALTHAAMYESNNAINTVFHIHDKIIWKGMIEADYDYTDEDIPYGTKEMADSVSKYTRHKNSGLIVMKGHEDGVISYGKNSQEAGDLLLKVYNIFHR